jgi:hypothetical protein
MPKQESSVHVLHRLRIALRGGVAIPGSFEALAGEMEQATSLAEAEPLLLEADRLYDQCSEQIDRLKAIASRLRTD